jgi:hypothetical protein
VARYLSTEATETTPAVNARDEINRQDFYLFLYALRREQMKTTMIAIAARQTPMRRSSLSVKCSNLTRRSPSDRPAA